MKTLLDPVANRAAKWALKCRKQGSSPKWNGNREQFPVWKEASRLWEEMWDKHHSRKAISRPAPQRTMFARVTEIVCRRHGIDSVHWNMPCHDASANVSYPCHEEGTGHWHGRCTRCKCTRETIDLDAKKRWAEIEIRRILRKMQAT